MKNRRATIFSLLGTFATASLMRSARAATATPVSQASPDTPKATVIAGKPPILDFGDGVRVPCNKDAFLTLWEGKSYWLSFGAGRSHYGLQAQGQAVNYARAAMKLLLMTLAFAPERMDHIDNCGWRLKSRNIRDFVKGDIDLPGNPFWPNNDAFMGFGASDAPALSDFGLNLTGTDKHVDAFSAYVVFKKDVTLDSVRTKAQISPFG